MLSKRSPAKLNPFAAIDPRCMTAWRHPAERPYDAGTASFSSSRMRCDFAYSSGALDGHAAGDVVTIVVTHSPSRARLVAGLGLTPQGEDR
jgi:hypothetical protein